MAAPVLVLIGGQNSRPTYISPGMAAARMLADRLGAAYTVELHPRNGDRGRVGRSTASDRSEDASFAHLS